MSEPPVINDKVEASRPGRKRPPASRWRRGAAGLLALSVGMGVCAIWLFLDPPGDLGRVLPLVAGLLLAVVLGSTVIVQVPRHARLADDPSTVAETVASLVAGNWVRTVGWSLRAVLAAVMVALAA